MKKKNISPAYVFLLNTVEEIRKFEKKWKKNHLKKCTSSANQFLLHKCRNNRKLQKCTFFCFKFEQIYKSS